MKLIPLGINGYLPLNGRHSSCFLALFDDAAFILDAGTGAARLHEPAIRELMKPYAEWHVLLSHYHVDHSAGLYYAFTARRSVPLHVHAPVCPFVQADPVAAIRRYFEPPLNSYRLEDTSIVVHPMNRERFEIAGHTIQAWPQQHPGGSVGYRIDDAVAYVTDAVVKMHDAPRVRGVGMLLHELWLNDEDAAAHPKENQRHACFGPVSDFVAAAKPERFMPVHLYPHYPDKAIAAMTAAIAKSSGVPAEVPVEGRVYDVG